MADLINNPGNPDRAGAPGNALAQNYRKPHESTQFGTRKLAFYTFFCENLDLADNWSDNGSLYFQVIRALQEAGVELFWVGNPKQTDNSGNIVGGSINDWTGLFPSSAAGFTFAIPDEATNPNWTPNGYNFTNMNIVSVNDYDTNVIEINSPQPQVGTRIRFKGAGIPQIVEGRDYYVAESWTDGNAFIRISDTGFAEDHTGNPEYPEWYRTPGEILDLDSSNSWEYTCSFYNAWPYWNDDWDTGNGVVGDYIEICYGSWGDRPEWQAIFADNLHWRMGNILRGAAGWFNINRSQIRDGIYPAIWAA